MLESLNKNNDESIILWFIKQADDYPKNIAVIDNNKEYTYQQLLNDVYVTAAYLQSKEVGCKDFIGTHQERSYELIVTILAIIFIGGIYVPIDFDLDIKIKLKLSEELKLNKVIVNTNQDKTAIFNDKLIDINYILNCEENFITKNTPTPYINKDMMIRQTSGSTGIPKCILISQKSMLNRIKWYLETYPSSNQDIYSMKTSLGFVDSAVEILTPLLIGGSLVVIPQIKDVEKMLKYFIKHKISHLYLVPTLLKAILLFATNEQIQALKIKYYLIGGEILSSELVNEFFEKLLNSRLINLYGTTEIGDIAYYEVKKTDVGCTFMPIGKCLNYLSLYLIDENIKQVDFGSRGEICLAGDTLPVGYLNNKEQTKKKFIFNHFNDNNTILHRTGDLAKYDESGNLIYLGRIDNQIKYRGFLIEPEYIESVICKSNMISNVVIKCQKDFNNMEQLIAYIKITNNCEWSLTRFKQELTKLLPTYMEPTYFKIINNFLLTNTGKIDRNKLPKIQFSTNYIIDSEREEIHTLKSIFCSVKKYIRQIHSLENEVIELSDDLMLIGLDSIAILQFALAINKQFKINIEISEILKCKSLSTICNKILTEVNKPNIKPNINYIKDDHLALTELQKVYIMGEKEALPLANIVAQTYFLFDIGNLDLTKLTTSWNSLINNINALRSTINKDKWDVLDSKKTYHPKTYVANDNTSLDDLLYLHTVKNRYKTIKTNKWPLFNIVFFKTDEKQYAYIEFALILLDETSVFNIIKLWCDEYNNHRSINEKTNSWYKNKVSETDVSYWRDKIKKIPKAPNIPYKKNIESCFDQEVCEYVFTINKKDLEKIKNISKTHNITVSAFIYFCYALILSKWSNTRLFTVSILHLNKRFSSIDNEKVINNLTDISLLSTSINYEDSFITNMHKIQKEMQVNLNHSNYSGVDVLRKIHQRDKCFNISFPITFASLLGHDYSKLDKFIKLLDTGVQTPFITLDCIVYELNDDLYVKWLINKKILDASIITDMQISMKKLILNFANGSTQVQQKTQVQLLKSQYKKITTKKNNFKLPNIEVSLYKQFLVNMEKQPHNTAVISGNKTISNLELYNYAANLAIEINQIIIPENDIIGILLPKGYKQVISILGVLLAGKAFLPISTDDPIDRIKKIFKKSNIKTIICDKKCIEKYVEEIDNYILINNINSIKPNKYNPLITPANSIAYVIYTSGSTGDPKGVVMEHQSVMNTIFDIITRWDLNKSDIFMMISDFNFDLAIFDIFASLYLGCLLVIPNEKHKKNVKYIYNLIKDYKVSVINAVPSTVDMIAEHMCSQKQKLSNVKLVLLSGDWIPLYLPSKIKKYFNNVNLISLGGATECGIWSIYYEIHKIFEHWRSIPYGKALTNQEVLVLDNNLQLCPIGVIGNIYISGKSLARGYWLDDELTEEKFILSENKKERLFDTADLGRYMFDGNIEIIGRRDRQIKISGYRVEINEVQQTIEKTGLCKNVVVLAVGEKYNLMLVVFFVKKGKKPNIVNDIKKALALKLSPYMIPKRLISIDKIPLTNNGKINNNKLLDISKRKEKVVNIDEEICKVFHYLSGYVSSLLNIKISLSKRNNIFELGMSSLQVFQLIIEISEKYKIEITAQKIYSLTDIRNIADYIKDNELKKDDSNLLAISKNKNKTSSLIFVHALNGSLTPYNKLIEHYNTEYNIYGLQNHVTKPTEISDLVSVYAKELVKEFLHKDFFLIGWSYGGILAYELNRELIKHKVLPLKTILIDSFPYRKTNNKFDGVFHYFTSEIQKQFSICLDEDKFISKSDKDKLFILFDELGELNILPKSISFNIFINQYNVFKYNLEAYKRYEVNPQSSNINIITPTCNKKNNKTEINIWKEQAPTIEHNIYGTHYSILSKDYINTINAISDIIN